MSRPRAIFVEGDSAARLPPRGPRPQGRSRPAFLTESGGRGGPAGSPSSTPGPEGRWSQAPRPRGHCRPPPSPALPSPAARAQGGWSRDAGRGEIRETAGLPTMLQGGRPGTPPLAYACGTPVSSDEASTCLVTFAQAHLAYSLDPGLPPAVPWAPNPYPGARRSLLALRAHT